MTEREAIERHRVAADARERALFLRNAERAALGEKAADLRGAASFLEQLACWVEAAWDQREEET